MWKIFSFNSGRLQGYPRDTLIEKYLRWSGKLGFDFPSSPGCMVAVTPPGLRGHRHVA